MTRRVVETKAATLDNEQLTIITVFEKGVNKEQIKKMSGFSKTHDVLIQRGNVWEYKAK
ncbi:hypothetical protein [Pseudobacillus badius]|uniref:hypothetical protein n=1 Tax=Bacillus badius TaxID=1455 RepID=UPI001CBBDA7E|nr:hypothetical protein [Bacillus badius]UAT29445.1 hypothetical protein K7T73_12630 [Bacillus badius]GLY11381.1 hypothetical protein Bbad01_25970 [Bacillus badius]